jgi:hypothetical protein
MVRRTRWATGSSDRQLPSPSVMPAHFSIHLASSIYFPTAWTTTARSLATLFPTPQPLHQVVWLFLCSIRLASRLCMMCGSLYRQIDNLSPLSIWFFWMSECFMVYFLCIAHIILRYILLIPDFKIWADYGHFLFKILNFCLPTSKKGAFSSGWEGPLVSVVVTGTTQPGLKVLHMAQVACCGWRTL